MKIIDAGQKCGITIGFALNNFPLNKHPGSLKKF